MKRRDFCKALVCSAALAPGLALPRAEAAAKSQTVGRAVPAGNYTMSFRSELSQMDIEHEYYYSDRFFLRIPPSSTTTSWRWRRWAW